METPVKRFNGETTRPRRIERPEEVRKVGGAGLGGSSASSACRGSGSDSDVYPNSVKENDFDL
jgi:hypothetical protein